ncbi:hypothetical protein V9T40_014783 [Parthenolecanium corni]|uniref:Uncharacterized protein n=1 Tax=Parthenolecanium corni TaxID=536013 RepID=A0AAN9TH55_9HEMI
MFRLFFCRVSAIRHSGIFVDDANYGAAKWPHLSGPKHIVWTKLPLKEVYFVVPPAPAALIYISQNSVECATALLIYNYFPFCLQQIKDELSEVVAEIQNTDSADDRCSTLTMNVVKGAVYVREESVICKYRLAVFYNFSDLLFDTPSAIGGCRTDSPWAINAAILRTKPAVSCKSHESTIKSVSMTLD